MSNRRSLAWAACALVSLGATAHAQSTTAAGPSPAPVDISPYVSTASGEPTGIGTSIRWPTFGKVGLEVDTEYRGGAVKGLDSSVNLVYDLPLFRRVTPYVVGGLGVGRFGVAQYVSFPTPGLVVGHATTAFVDLGGGVRVPLTDRWSFRADLRYSAPFADQAPERVRVFTGVTVGLGKR